MILLSLHHSRACGYHGILSKKTVKLPHSMMQLHWQTGILKNTAKYKFVPKHCAGVFQNTCMFA